MRNTRTRPVAALLAALALLGACARPGAAGIGQPAPDAGRSMSHAPRSAVTTPTQGSGSAPGSVISAPLPTLDAAEAALQSAMPGLFGAADLHPTIDGDVISIWSQQDCTALLGVLRAGQWSLDLVHQPTKKGQRSWVAAMRQGDASALLLLNGGPGGCSGQITHDRPVRVSASGAANVTADGRFLSFLCTPEWDTTESGSDDGSGSGSSSGSASASGSGSSEPVPSQEFLIGLYTVGARPYVVEGELPTKPGTYHVTAADIAAAEGGDDDSESPGVGIMMLPKKSDAMTMLITSFGPLLYPLDLSSEQDESSLGEVLAKYPTYGGGPKTSETITITSTSPVSGSFTAHALAEEQHHSKATLDFSAPFTCDR